MSTTIASATNSTTATGTSATAAAPTALGQDDFLKLLMAQLGNQDPSNPVDGSAFVAQLAQFASVQQLTGVNSRLDSVLLAQASQSQTNAASLVGKEAVYNSNTLNLTSSGATPGMANLSQSAATVTAVISDATGKVVRTLQLGAQAAGPLAINWDGRDSAGSPLAPGAYTVNVTAAAAGGTSIPVTSEAQGLVTGVSFVNGYPQLMLGAQTIKMSDVLQITQVPPSP